MKKTRETENIVEKKEERKRSGIIKKKQKINALIEEIKKYPVIAAINLRYLPDSLLQSLKKKLRALDGSVVYVSKLIVIKKVLESIGLGKESAKLCNPTALLLTKQSPYKLSSFFMENRKKVGAKPGQIAPFDIVVPEGDTDLPPGPVLSELKGAGINVQIKSGKLSVVKDSLILEKDERISAIKAKALQTLNIRPFEVGAELCFVYDGKIVYSPEVLSITKEYVERGVIEGLKNAFNLSINAHYITPWNIDLLLKEALIQSKNLEMNEAILVSDAKT